MSELNNTATSIGNYNSVPTNLTSNTSIVNINQLFPLHNNIYNYYPYF